MIRDITSHLKEQLNIDDQKYWFDLKNQKFLHNVDTAYFSIKLKNNFTVNSKDANTLAFRNYIKDYQNQGYGSVISFDLPGTEEYSLICRPITFAGFYNFNISCPDLFDIFVAPVVPGTEDDPDQSVTAEINLQLRSYILWQYGVTKAFEYGYKCVKAICDFFNLEIEYVHENRFDYCWHSNYLMNPEKFFNIERFAKMQVSHYKGVTYHYTFTPNDNYDNDYVALGKRSDKCFVRIYNKTREVIEQGYKSWFFKEWLFNGLINRYDFYCLEKAFIKRSFNELYRARLTWYMEYGTDDFYKSECSRLLGGNDINAISTLADLLTPAITIITNVEYQTMRRMSKSFVLLKIRDNSDKGAAQRVYDYLDNHLLITDYLTNHSLRLIDPSTDSRKSRCDYCHFWKALRAAKMVDVKKNKHDLQLVREYSSQLNSQVLKKRIMSSITSFNLYQNGINSNDIFSDSFDFLNYLNDNDIYELQHKKITKMKQLKNKLPDAIRVPGITNKYFIVSKETGQIIGG